MHEADFSPAACFVLCPIDTDAFIYMTCSRKHGPVCAEMSAAGKMAAAACNLQTDAASF